MQLDQLERREAIAVIVGAAAAWPFPACAQRPTVPAIGYLYVGAPEASAHLIMAYRNGLSETGYAMVGGLALSQLLTLYTTPVVYLYLDRLQTWLRRNSCGATGGYGARNASATSIQRLPLSNE